MCLNCSRTFGWSNKSTSWHQQRVWFERWITEGYTIKQLSAQSGKSRRNIRRLINYWLKRPPSQKPAVGGVKHLIFDGTYVKGRVGVFAVMDGLHNRLISGRYGVQESYPQLIEFFGGLRLCGLRPQTATVDGNLHLSRALPRCWPQIKLQRCLVHLQRQGLAWCRHQPKRTDAKKLRKILLSLSYITTPDQKQQFIQNFESWEQCYGPKIASSPEKGWVFSDLKRARSMLLNALPQMFLYLTNSNVPKTTNPLEGYFARLKQRYRQHRGIIKSKRPSYFSWFFHLVRR